MNAVLASIARNGQEWSFNTRLDMGVLGEQPIEVFYIHFYGRKSNDPFQVPDPEHCQVTSVEWEGKDITDKLNSNLLDDLSIEAQEDWQS